MKFYVSPCHADYVASPHHALYSGDPPLLTPCVFGPSYAVIPGATHVKSPSPNPTTRRGRYMDLRPPNSSKMKIVNS